MTINDAMNNKNLNNNSNGKVKWIIKWKKLCRRNDGSTKKAEDSFDKVVYKAPLKRNCCDVCKLFSCYFLFVYKQLIRGMTMKWETILIKLIHT